MSVVYGYIYFSYLFLLQIRALYSKKEEQMAANKSLATFNLSKEPELQAKKEALAAKQAEAQALVKQLQTSRAKLEAKTGKHRYFSRVKMSY